MPYNAAVEREQKLALELRLEGYKVYGGHWKAALKSSIPIWIHTAQNILILSLFYTPNP